MKLLFSYIFLSMLFACANQQANEIGKYSDQNWLPLVKVEPLYPKDALAKEISGWVILGYTVHEYGGTENITVIDSFPSDIFDQTGIEALSRFRYRPRIVDGKAVAVPRVQCKFTFDIVVRQIYESYNSETYKTFGEIRSCK